jgi:hypothetical protein
MHSEISKKDTPEAKMSSRFNNPLNTFYRYDTKITWLLSYDRMFTNLGNSQKANYHEVKSFCSRR